MSADWWSQKLAPAQPPRFGLTVQPQPVQYPVQPVSPHQVAQPQQEELPPTAEIHAIDAVRRWKGSTANRIGGECPNCGSKISYTPGYLAGQINGASARAHCFECGHVQGSSHVQGDAANWGQV